MKTYDPVSVAVIIHVFTILIGLTFFYEQRRGSQSEFIYGLLDISHHKEITPLRLTLCQSLKEFFLHLI